MAKISHEDFVKKVYELVGDEYIVLSEYTDSQLKVKFKHNTRNCGRQFEMRASHFTSTGCRCPHCKHKNHKPGKRQKQLEQSIIDNIIDLYVNKKETIRNIANIIGEDRRIISKVLKENNIDIIYNKHHQKDIADNNIYIQIFKEKTKNNSYSDLAKKYNVPYGSIFNKKYLKDQIDYDKKAKHTLDVNYFRCIDTENKAYLLGFIMADGNVNKTSKSNPRANRLSINISYKDISILKFAKKEFNSDESIEIYTPKKTFSNNKMARIHFNSLIFCDHLSKFGVIPNKTGKEKFPKNGTIPKELMRHFIRGFFDGDGCSFSNGKISFCSNKEFLEDLKEFLIKNCNMQGSLNIRYDNRDKHLYYLDICSYSDCDKFKKYIYKNAKFYLERKYKNFR